MMQRSLAIAAVKSKEQPWFLLWTFKVGTANNLEIRYFGLQVSASSLPYCVFYYSVCFVADCLEKCLGLCLYVFVESLHMSTGREAAH